MLDSREGFVRIDLAKFLPSEVSIETCHDHSLIVVISCSATELMEVWKELGFVDDDHLHNALPVSVQYKLLVCPTVLSERCSVGKQGS